VEEGGGSGVGDATWRKEGGLQGLALLVGGNRPAHA
jgi:hypothetical protein